MIGIDVLLLCAACVTSLYLLLAKHSNLREDLMMMIETPLEFDREEAQRHALALLCAPQVRASSYLLSQQNARWNYA